MAKFSALFVAIALFLLAAPAAAQSAAQRGDQAMSAGNYASAGDAYRQAATDTGDPAFYKKAGAAYMELGAAGKDRAVAAFRSYIQGATTLSEAEEGERLLKDAQALPDEAPPPPPRPTPAPAPSAQPEPSNGTPATGGGEEKKPEDPRTDHQKVVGTFGVGWYGVSNIPIAQATPGGDDDNPAVAGFSRLELAAPAVGLRYWISELVGLDVALGIHYSTGSSASATASTTTTTDKQPRFGMMIHAGLPLALATGKHVAFIMVPEMNLGFATSSRDPEPGQDNAPPAASLSGVRFDLGARAGLELQFGFMGVPELALEGTIGAFFTYQAVNATVDSASQSENDILLTTASFDDPWDIFLSSIAARYYF